jgi:hypothetical protein
VAARRSVLALNWPLSVCSPAIRQHRQGQDRAAVREHHRLTLSALGPQLDLAVNAATGKPAVG